MSRAQKSLPVKHPLRSAKWIWPEAYMYLHNHYAHFRKDFEFEKVPKKVPLFITADKAYKLYVNGQYICRGPARGYQSHWPFDEVDLAKLLTKGHNWISIEAYNPGISTFQYLHQAKAGLLCQAKWGDFSLSAGQPWQMRRSPAHSTQTARLSLQLDFQEHFDCRRDDRSWIISPTPPAGWRAEIFPDGSHAVLSSPFGQPPYDSVEPRGIPLMAERLLAPAKVTAHACGTCGEGYQTWENVSWGWVAEGLKVQKWNPPEGVNAAVRDGWLEVAIPPAGAGKFTAITIDLGEYLIGNLLVRADGARGGEILDFQHDQCLCKGYPEFLRPGDGCLVALANRMRLAAGGCGHEFFHIIGARHVTMIARDFDRQVTVRLQYRSVGYPFGMNGTFDCSDSTLNEIYEICRRTQKLCSLDAYVDTPWREQAQWWGDARVQAKNTFYLDGDASLLARGIRSIAGQQAPHGLTYGHAPTSSGWCILPDFALTWILTVWDHYWQTGNLKLVKEQWPRIKQVLGYFQDRHVHDERGLLKYDERFWLFEDWSTLPKSRTPTFLNLWYMITLRQAAELAGLAGKKADAKKIDDCAVRHEELAVKHLFDPAAKLFAPCLDEQGKQSGAPSVHDQTMAIMLGLVPQAHQTMIEQRLLPYLENRQIPGDDQSSVKHTHEQSQDLDAAVAKPSSFWCTYVLETMGQLGYGRQVVEFIRKKWTPMLSTGTTWEGFEWDETKGWSACHAWTAHPSFHFVNVLAGLTQTAPAWRQIKFSPQFVAGIDNVKSTVPSPLGPIEAAWKRTSSGISATLTIPAGVNAKIDLPDKKEDIAGPKTCEYPVKA